MRWLPVLLLCLGLSLAAAAEVVVEPAPPEPPADSELFAPWPPSSNPEATKLYEVKLSAFFVPAEYGNEEGDVQIEFDYTPEPQEKLTSYAIPGRLLQAVGDYVAAWGKNPGAESLAETQLRGASLRWWMDNLADIKEDERLRSSIRPCPLRQRSVKAAARPDRKKALRKIRDRLRQALDSCEAELEQDPDGPPPAPPLDIPPSPPTEELPEPTIDPSPAAPEPTPATPEEIEGSPA